TISNRAPRFAKPGRDARYREAARAMRVRCSGVTASAASRTDARALTSMKQTGPKGDSVTRSISPAWVLMRRPRIRWPLSLSHQAAQASLRWPRFSAIKRSALVRSAIFLLQPPRINGMAGDAQEAGDHFRRRLERHEGQRPGQCLVYFGEINLGFGRAPHQQRHFALGPPFLSISVCQLRQIAAAYFFMQLGDLARHAGSAGAENLGHVLQ